MTARLTPTAPAEPAEPAAVVRQLPCVRDDAELLAGLEAGELWARAALFDRYAPMLERLVRRLMGPGAASEIPDLVHDVFVQALTGLDRLQDAKALPAWLQTIATRTAYRAIRSRQARRWLRFWEPAELPEVAVDGIEPEISEAYRRTYALLEKMPAAERVPFVLRYVEKLELRDIARACDVSLATIKRRIGKGKQRFCKLAAGDEVLRPWLEGGELWTK